MKNIVTRFAVLAAAVGISFGAAAGTAAAGDWIYIGTYQREADCEAEAVKWRSSDVGAWCRWDQGHTEWDLLIRSY